MDTVELPAKCADAFTERVEYWRRTLSRGAGRSPPRLLRLAIARTAALEAEAERVLADPAATANDKVRVANAARIMRRDLAEMFATRQAQEDRTPTLAELLAEPTP